MARTIFIGDAVFGAAIGFLSGILAAGFGWNLLAIGMLGAIVVASTIFSKNASFFATIAAIILAAFFFGASYYHFFSARRAAETKLPTGKGMTFSAIITDEPDATAKYLLLEAQLEKPYAGAITIFAPLDPAAGSTGGFRYGDEVRITSPLEPAQTPGDTPAAFPKKLELISEHRGLWLREDLLDFKAAVLQKFNEALPSGDEAALLSGETLGGTDGMSVSLKNEMSASGTSYITAMYGYKIFVIAGFVEAVLANFVSRRVRFFAALGSVALFVVMAGGGASVVRGAIMGSLGLIAKNAGRISSMRNSLAFTAATMALWDPTIVAQAVFLLSFLSVIGMAYLAKPIENFFGWGNRSSSENGIASILDWREAIVIAAASLLPIIPTIVASFGDFSLSSFPSNALIALPLPAVTFFGFVLALAGFILPSFISRLATFFIAPFASIVLRYQLAVIKIFAAIVVPLPAWFDSPIVFTIYFAALIWFAWAYRAPTIKNKNHDTKK
jgi:ComEC/Rec2-related protein